MAYDCLAGVFSEFAIWLKQLSQEGALLDKRIKKKFENEGITTDEYINLAILTAS